MPSRSRPATATSAVDFWAPFLTFVAVTAFTPGPNNLLSFGNAGTFGLRASIPMLLGMAISFLVVMAVCGLATAALSGALPAAMPVLRVLGSAYILWLAWNLMRSGCPERRSSSRVCSFRQAFLLQFLNVKVLLYGITAFSTFVLPRTSDPRFLAGIAVLLAFAGNCANWTWALAGHALHRLFAKYGRPINFALALLLAVGVLGLWVESI